MIKYFPAKLAAHSARLTIQKWPVLGKQGEGGGGEGGGGGGGGVRGGVASSTLAYFHEGRVDITHNVKNIRIQTFIQ